MPSAAPRPCTYPGCGVLRCDKHRDHARRAADARRESAHARGYTNRWQQYRASYLRAHPMCVRCLARKLLVPATDVDHVTPVSGPDDPRFWESMNHQGLCHSCHSEKTATEDGGFGRAGRGHPISSRPADRP